MHTTVDEDRMASGGGSFLVGLLWGAAAGAVIGLILAPKPGHELRRDMSHSARRMRTQAMKSYNDASRTMEDAMAKGRRAYEAGRQAFQDARAEAEPLIRSHAPLV